MQPTAAEHPNRLKRRLASLRDHPVVGMPVRVLRRREQVLYLVVGAWNTVFGYGIWALLQFLIGDRVHYLVVVLIAWPLAVLNAYFGYRWFVFRSHGSIVRELPRFSLVYLATLLVNLALLPILLDLLPFNIYVVQALLLTVVVVASYLGHKYFSFGNGRSRFSAAAGSDRQPHVTKEP
jgi:putative flippase GtrA